MRKTHLKSYSNINQVELSARGYENRSAIEFPPEGTYDNISDAGSQNNQLTDKRAHSQMTALPVAN